MDDSCSDAGGFGLVGIVEGEGARNILGGFDLVGLSIRFHSKLEGCDLGGGVEGTVADQ